MADDTGGPRYAVYFAPERGSALHRFGSAWLGRDAETDAVLEQPKVAGIAPERLAEITAFPRRYGFHATLKAPFKLAAGIDEATLVEAVADLVATRAPFASPPLKPAVIDGWRALVLASPCPSMQGLCDELVAGLDDLRAPPDAAEIERRLAGGLDPRRRALLQRWGYPGVFDAFWFHMTLTGRIGAAEGEAVDTALPPLVAELTAAPLAVRGVAVFVQMNQDSPFLLRRRITFDG